MARKTSARRKTYLDFLGSPEWAKIRADIFTVRGCRCEFCGSSHVLHIHHVSYDNFGGQEEPEDLVILCKKCHSREHGAEPKPENKWKARREKKKASVERKKKKSWAKYFSKKTRA